MGANSKIEWTTHTFNAWIGCTKISPACDNCYAAEWGRRFGVGWGTGVPRQRTAESTWKQPRRWNREAERLGIRYRVFCNSMADVFDNEVNPQWRISLFQLIDQTPHLDWLLLTKRIGNARTMLESAFRAVHHGRQGWADNVPPNVWLGASITTQTEADRDIPKLLATPAAKRFLSMEPLLGPVDLHLALTTVEERVRVQRAVERTNGQLHRMFSRGELLNWVIVGGESGPHARPMHPEWARSLRDQCTAAGAPFFMKQMTKKAPIPDDLFIREIPDA